MGVDTVSRAEFFVRHLPGPPPSEKEAWERYSILADCPGLVTPGEDRRRSGGSRRGRAYPRYFRCLSGEYLRQGNPGAVRAPIAPFGGGPDDFHANLGVFHARVLYPGRFLRILTILKVLQGRVKRK